MIQGAKLERVEKENPKTPILPKVNVNGQVAAGNGTAQSVNKPFTKQDIQSALNEFKTVLRNFPQDRDKARKASEYLLGGKVEIKEDFTIEFTFDDEAKTELIDFYKEKIERNLRNRLENQALNLKVLYEYVEKKKKYYTPYEQFQYLKEKHQKLNDLSDRFGLEVDL